MEKVDFKKNSGMGERPILTVEMEGESRGGRRAWRAKRVVKGRRARWFGHVVHIPGGRVARRKVVERRLKP